MYYFHIDFLKCIAVLLIINSHMDPIYPYSAMATGGAMGNALFFIASGYLLAGKEKKKKFWKKFFMRIYIPLTVVNVFFFNFQSGNFLASFFWPTNFWFIGAIVLFYFLYYVLEKINAFKYYNIIFWGLTSLYIIIYVFALDTRQWVVETAGLSDLKSSFKLIYYFAIMIIGGLLKNKNFTSMELYVSKYVWILSIFFLYISKYFISTNSDFMYMQFTSQLFTMTFAISFFIWSTGSFVRRLERVNIVKMLVKKLSSLSLELYLVQFFVISMCSQFRCFPLNVIVSFVLMICIAGLLQKVSRLLIGIIEKSNL